MFVKCTNGEPEYLRCADGQLFNSESLQCDKKELVDCGSRDFYYFNAKGPIPMDMYYKGNEIIDNHI